MLPSCPLGPQSTTLLAPRTDLVEDSFSIDWDRGMFQAVMQVMGTDGKWQMKLHSLAQHSPPDEWPGFYQLAHQYWSAAGGLGTPALGDLLETEPEKDKCRKWRPQWPLNPDAAKHRSPCLGFLPVVQRGTAGCALGWHAPRMLTVARAALLLLILYCVFRGQAGKT